MPNNSISMIAAAGMRSLEPVAQGRVAATGNQAARPQETAGKVLTPVR